MKEHSGASWLALPLLSLWGRPGRQEARKAGSQEGRKPGRQEARKPGSQEARGRPRAACGGAGAFPPTAAHVKDVLVAPRRQHVVARPRHAAARARAQPAPEGQDAEVDTGRAVHKLLVPHFRRVGAARAIACRAVGRGPADPVAALAKVPVLAVCATAGRGGGASGTHARAVV